MAKTKPIFDMNAYPRKTAIHCRTKRQAAAVMNWLNSMGMRWCNNVEYSPETSKWDVYESSTGYDYNRGMYGEMEYYEDNEYLVLDASDFSWKINELSISEAENNAFESFISSFATANS